MQHVISRSTGLFMYTFMATAVLMTAGNAYAESGAYIGGSVGSATVAVDIPDDLGATFEFDENDFAWKAFGGYNFDLAVVDLAIEVGYVDLGAPSADLLGSAVELDVNGWDVFGVLGFDIGPIGLFAKAGMVSWDVSATIDSIDAGSDDGSDPAYGVGASFALGNLEIRAEYEMFDIDPEDTSSADVYMLSAGLVYNFGG
ncbi:MAG: outer membrane beta-barrel protein [Woeseiaceae bacterium]|nr:outer membrane beta-barrel protein [Woeseiaceae bacterium]